MSGRRRKCCTVFACDEQATLYPSGTAAFSIVEGTFEDIGAYEFAGQTSTDGELILDQEFDDGFILTEFAFGNNTVVGIANHELYTDETCYIGFTNASGEKLQLKMWITLSAGKFTLHVQPQEVSSGGSVTDLGSEQTVDSLTVSDDSRSGARCAIVGEMYFDEQYERLSYVATLRYYYFGYQAVTMRHELIDTDASEVETKTYQKVFARIEGGNQSVDGSTAVNATIENCFCAQNYVRFSTVQNDYVISGAVDDGTAVVYGWPSWSSQINRTYEDRREADEQCDGSTFTDTISGGSIADPPIYSCTWTVIVQIYGDDIANESYVLVSVRVKSLATGTHEELSTFQKTFSGQIDFRSLVDEVIPLVSQTQISGNPQIDWTGATVKITAIPHP